MTYSASVHTGSHSHNVSGAHDDEAGRRCAMHFNPSAPRPTDKIKSFHAAAMKAVIDERNSIAKPADDATSAEKAAYGDAMRCFATALTHLETAQMFAVKGLHTRSNAGIKGG